MRQIVRGLWVSDGGDGANHNAWRHPGVILLIFVHMNIALYN